MTWSRPSFNFTATPKRRDRGTESFRFKKAMALLDDRERRILNGTVENPSCPGNSPERIDARERSRRLCQRGKRAAPRGSDRATANNYRILRLPREPSTACVFGSSRVPKLRLGNALPPSSRLASRTRCGPLPPSVKRSFKDQRFQGRGWKGETAYLPMETLLNGGTRSRSVYSKTSPFCNVMLPK